MTLFKQKKKQHNITLNSNEIHQIFQIVIKIHLLDNTKKEKPVKRIQKKKREKIFVKRARQRN